MHALNHSPTVTNPYCRCRVQAMHLPHPTMLLQYGGFSHVDIRAMLTQRGKADLMRASMREGLRQVRWVDPGNGAQGVGCWCGSVQGNQAGSVSCRLIEQSSLKRCHLADSACTHRPGALVRRASEALRTT